MWPSYNGSSTMCDKLKYFTCRLAVQNQKSNDEYVNIPHVKKDFFSKLNDSSE